MTWILVKRFCGMVGAMLAAMAALAVLATAARADGAPVSNPIPQSPSEVRAFWTAERMRAAQPVDMPTTPAPGFADARQPRPAASPTVIPATEGSATLKREAGSETSFPQSVHGKLFFTIPANESHGEGLASCSGTVVASRLQDVVFTAGHCAQYPGEAPPSDMIFVPGYRDGAEPFGEFPVSTLLTPKEWSTNFAPSYDFAVAELASPIEKTLGARGIAFNKAPKTSYSIFGYPAEPAPTYNGERLIVCDASFFDLEYSGSHPFSTVASPCDMGPGASGGGWVNPAGDVVSVSSHIYDDPQYANLIVGPYFGQAAKKLYNAAGGSAQCPPAKRELKVAKRKAGKARKVARRSRSRHAMRHYRKAEKRLSKAQSRRHNYC